MTKRRIAVLAVTLAVGIGFVSPVLAITKDEIISLASFKIPADEIIKAIEKDRTIFNLAIEDILELKNAGVPEEVIRFMMSTPQRYGSETPPVDNVVTDPNTPPVDKPPVVEKTPEEIRAEAERARLEEQKRKEAEDRLNAERRRIEAEKKLKAAMESAERGEYLVAVPAFERFVENGAYPPESDEFYAAEYGKGLALARAGFWKTAGDILVNVVLQGPDKPYFVQGFYLLREARKHVELNYPTLEDLAKFVVGNFDQKFQDSYNYFLGEFFFESRMDPRALYFFEMVSANSEDSAKALYLSGVIHVRGKMYKTAVESFQNAIIADEKREVRTEVSEMGYMALARIAATLGDYDAAIYYYRQVSKESLQGPIALYESAWAYFKKGDFSRALGALHALHSPSFEHFFYPELWIVEATIYLNMCQYDLAKESLAMFRQHVSALRVPLEDFLKSMRTPAEYYLALEQVIEGKGSYNLPVRLLYPVLGHVDFFNVYRTIRQMEWERKQLEANRATLGRFGEERIAMLEAERASQINVVGGLVQELLERTVRLSLKDYDIRATEVEVDLDQVEMEKIEMQTQMLLQKEQLDRAVESLVVGTQRGMTVAELTAIVQQDPIFKEFTRQQISQLEAAGVDEKVIDAVERISGVDSTSGGSGAIVGSDSLEWPFEGEYWVDELWSYRSFLNAECLQ